MSDADQAAARVALFFETLTPSALAQLGEVYTQDASFKDPFNEVQGLDAIRAIYHHMYQALDAPRFVVTGQLAGPGECFLRWEFHFRFQGRLQNLTIRGATHLLLASDGRISVHRDYWDAAEELYEKLPVLASLMRWLKRRART